MSKNEATPEDTKEAIIRVRTTRGTKAAVYKRSTALGRKAPEMMNEIFEAFVDGRLKITPKPEQREAQEGLYQC